MESITLKLAEKQSTVDPPVVAVFPSGIPTEICEKNDFAFQYLASKDPRKPKHGVMYAETSQTRFVGNNFESDSLSRSQNNFAIAVYRPGKSNAKVINANGLFTVKQTKLSDTSGIDTETVTESDFNTIRTELTERFGSRKRRRELRSIENNKFNVESSESSMLALSTALDVAQELVQDAIPEAVSDPMLPKYNAEATESHLIYPFTSFLPKALWSSLDVQSIIKPTISKEEIEFTYPSYVVLRMTRFTNLKGEDANMLARQLLMITYLLRLLKARKAKSIASAIQCPPTIGDYLKRTYMPQGDTKESKAKILCHAVILALNSSVSQVMDTDSLACFSADTQTALSQLMPYFIRVGAKASKTKCKLTAPLVLPNIQVSGGGNKRR